MDNSPTSYCNLETFKYNAKYLLVSLPGYLILEKKLPAIPLGLLMQYEQKRDGRLGSLVNTKPGTAKTQTMGRPFFL